MESSFLGSWLLDGYSIGPQLSFDMDLSTGCRFLLRISHCCNLDEADDTRLIPYEVSRIACWDYLNRACNIIGAKIGYPERGPIQANLQSEIIAQLGPPPLESYSLYIITLTDPRTTIEKTVYVGQTKATQSRFREAHAVISSLQSPSFSNAKKNIYFARLSAIYDADLITPIEWMTAPKIRDTIFDSVESRLILKLRPEFNRQDDFETLDQRQQPLIIQNVVSRFLDAETFSPDLPNPMPTGPSQERHSRIKFWRNKRIRRPAIEPVT